MIDASSSRSQYPLTLLVRPLPHHDESAKGYLLRTIHANDLHFDMWAFCRFIGIQSADTRHSAVWLARHLHSRTQRAQGDHENGAALKTGGRMAGTAVCPDCLAEHGYRRLEWDLPLSAVCFRHQCGLIRSCCKCHRGLCYGIGSLFLCRCGQDLRQMNTCSSRGVTKHYLEVLAPWRENLSSHWPLGDLVHKEFQVLDLIRASTSLAQRGRLAAYIKTTHCADVEKIEDFQPLLKNWPRSILDIAEECYEELALSDRALLAAIARDAQQPFIEERLNELARMSRQGPWTLRPDRPSHDAVTLESVGRALRITRKEATLLLKTGRLAEPIPDDLTESRMPMDAVCKSELARAWFVRWYSLSEKEAAKYLHCSPDWISALNRHGFMASCVIPPLSSVRYLVRDTVDFLKRLKSRACPAESDGHERVCLASVRLVPWRTASHGWISLMDAIRLRKILLFSHGHDALGLQNFSVLLTDVEQLGCELASDWHAYRNVVEQPPEASPCF